MRIDPYEKIFERFNKEKVQRVRRYKQALERELIRVKDCLEAGEEKDFQPGRLWFETPAPTLIQRKPGAKYALDSKSRPEPDVRDVTPGTRG
jgi:hypothetical protein